MSKPIEHHEVTVADGKYTLVYEVWETPDGKQKVSFYARRLGERWRDLTGDGMILALMQRIEELEEEIEDASDAACDDLREARLRG